MKGQVFVQGEVITEMEKWGEVIKKIFSSRITEPEELRFT
jgi:hypothetical protein